MHFFSYSSALKCTLNHPLKCALLSDKRYIYLLLFQHIISLNKFFPRRFTPSLCLDYKMEENIFFDNWTWTPSSN